MKYNEGKVEDPQKKEQRLDKTRNMNKLRKQHNWIILRNGERKTKSSCAMGNSGNSYDMENI